MLAADKVEAPGEHQQSLAPPGGTSQVHACSRPGSTHSTHRRRPTQSAVVVPWVRGAVLPAACAGKPVGKPAALAACRVAAARDAGQAGAGACAAAVGLVATCTPYSPQ